MATQGIVSITDGGKVILKAVAGCDGYNASKLVAKIKTKNLRSAMEVYDAAVEVGFGCSDDLVVMTRRKTLYRGEGKIPKRYRATFADPKFNPRWVHGTASHTEVIEIGD